MKKLRDKMEQKEMIILDMPEDMTFHGLMSAIAKTPYTPRKTKKTTKTKKSPK